MHNYFDQGLAEPAEGAQGSASGDVTLESSLEPVSSLSRLVQLGLESENKMGMVLRAVKLGVSSSLCSVVSEMHSMTTASLSLMHTLRDRYAALLAEELPTMNREECYQEYSRLSDDLMELAKLEQRIAQGSQDLYPEDTFSAEDRKVLRLFSSLGSPEDKARVLKVLEEQFGSAEGFSEASDVHDASDYADAAKSGPSRGKRVASKMQKVQGVDAAGPVGAAAPSFDSGAPAVSAEFSSLEEE